MENEEKIRFINYEPSCDDMMRSCSHKNIANSIIRIITKTDKGMVIGLDGEYGSGKSTIIEIIAKFSKSVEEQKSKNADKKDIFIFKFDAWEHENDALRRIFLEGLIKEVMKEIEKEKESKKECVDKYNQKLDELINLKQEVSNRLKNTTLKKNITTKLYTKIIALSVLLVPLGVALNSQIKLMSSGKFETGYMIVIGLLILPVMAILLFPLYNLIEKYMNPSDKSKDIKKDYAFCSEEIIERNQIHSNIDNTSIEFNDYFNQIVRYINENNKHKKIVVVIDNLDRIDENIVLKIWQTIQIFVQNKNNNIYTLIPFDYNKMRKVWKDEVSYFFDKCFQLIIDVPKPIYSDISVYFKDKANEIFEDKAICNTAEMLIRKFNKSNDNIFTPRKINNYLNQIKMLLIRFAGYDIDLKVIIFYAYKRTLENKSAKELRSALIDGNLVMVGEKYLFDSLKEYESDFAAIIFGINKITAQQLLLIEQIRNTLYEEKEKLSLIDIYKKNTGVFSKYLHDVIRKDSGNISLILKGSVVIKRTIDEGPDELKDILKSEDCIKQFKNVFSDNLSLPWPPDTKQGQEIEQYVNFIELILQDKEAIEKFHKLYLKAITNYLNQNKRNEVMKSQALVEFIKKIMPKYMSYNKIKIEKVESLNESWFKAILMDESNLEVFKYILPEFDDDEILGSFQNNIANSTYVLNIINYLVQKNLNNYGEIIYVVVGLYFKYASLRKLQETEDNFKKSLNKLSETKNFEINISNTIEQLYNENIDYTSIPLINDVRNKLIKKYSLNIEPKSSI